MLLKRIVPLCWEGLILGPEMKLVFTQRRETLLSLELEKPLDSEMWR